jgi:hypothetical protein
MTYLKALVKRLYGLMVKYPLAVAAAVFLAVGAVVMALAGYDDVQIGGLLEKLFGKKKTNPDIRVVPPPERVDSDGNSIPLGESDEKGYVQAPINTKIVPPGVFSNPDTIVVVHPNKGEVTIPLPVGVKNKDVSEVVEIQPNVYEIRNNDRGVNTSELEEFLK